VPDNPPLRRRQTSNRPTWPATLALPIRAVRGNALRNAALRHALALCHA